jgi:hypothetical protein
MYKQGRRFGEGTNSKVPAYELSAMQARSYLAAINCLSLVDKRNAWIAIPASTNLKVSRRPTLFGCNSLRFMQCLMDRTENAAE